MKVLFVISGNVKPMPFVDEQKISLEEIGCEIDYFRIKGKGVFGYLRNKGGLVRAISEGDYDVVHAHYGLSGLLAVMQRVVPVVITFHGTDVNNKYVRVLSKIASYFAYFSIFVSENMAALIKSKKRYAIIPCGVDVGVFSPMERRYARKVLGLNPNRKYILFASSFNNPVKNSPLAMKAVDGIKSDVEVVELKGYSREQVGLLLNACNLLLMTSFSEGSPQIIKEALACNTPIVSTDVGDVADRTKGVSGCYIVDADPLSLANAMQLVIDQDKRTDGRSSVEELSLENVAGKILTIYREVVSK